MVTSALKQSNDFRPDVAEVEKFLKTAKNPKAIFLNSPHNPTGGVASEEDLKAIADLIRGKNIAVFSDEPYCHMVWEGRHHSILAQPGMMDQGVAAYTFSKSYSMSGWRLGFAVAGAEIAEAIGKMINTTLSCTPPIVQIAGMNALKRDKAEREQQMGKFREKVLLLTKGLNSIKGFKTIDPKATFYVFPSVAPVCNDLGITSHGLAMYFLEGADDQFGVACLGGECFGDAGGGFLRFSCAEPNDRLQQALDFLPTAISRKDRIAAYLEQNPKFRLGAKYSV
jgi:aspartate aminotransferase